MHELLWHECLICGDTISNRICYRCIESEVQKWLSVRNPTYIGALKRSSLFMDSYFHDGTECIMCGRNLNVCSKCYCMQVHKSLRRDRILASEFLDFAVSKGFVISSVKGVLNLKR